MTPQLAAGDRETLAGVLYALGAYGIWGLAFPVQLIVLRRLAEGEAASWSLELLAHRIVWSLVLCLLLVVWLGQRPALRRLVRDRRAMAVLGATTALVSVNWAVFIYATATGRLAEASLGYFINPLVSVLLGVIFLGERLRPAQVAALGVVVGGVAYKTFGLGQLPWISLTLAFSFGLYGLLRKRAATGPVLGLTVETALASPVAIGFLVLLGLGMAPGLLGLPDGAKPEFTASWAMAGLFVLSGVTTALPLLWFAAAAKKLRLATVGLMQYLAPTGQFAIAVTFGGEPLSAGDLAVFGLIWAGVAVFTWDAVRGHRRWKRGEAAAVA